ncbi:MAG TPA: M48 family metalloprotease [Solirubrobacteraceae bacterium]|nr:M48 family metalloprotease [Solirubrobacteraceae bacterium]
MEPSPPTTTTQTQLQPPPATRPPLLRGLWNLVLEAADRHGVTGLVGAVLAWTGLPIALWAAAIGAIAGAVAGVVGSTQVPLAHELHINQTVGLGGAILGFFVGAWEGFRVVYNQLINPPIAFIAAALGGVFIGVVVVMVMFTFEHIGLRLRGYRRMSRRETERVAPLVIAAAKGMDLRVVPQVWVADLPKPAAWAHMHAIVLSRGLLGDIDDTERPPRGVLDDAALGAVIAHELHHYKSGDSVSLRVIWACSYPLVLMFNIGSWLGSTFRFFAPGRLVSPSRLASALGWFLFWPAWVIIKLVLAPLVALDDRDHEYEADAAAARISEEYRLGLRRALAELSMWEQPRSGWEDAIAATHPPIELRLERLETPSEQLAAATGEPVSRTSDTPPRPVRRPKSRTP